jgi:hypothetical protein
MRPSVERLECRELLAHFTVLSRDGGSSYDVSGSVEFFHSNTYPFHVSGDLAYNSFERIRAGFGSTPACVGDVGISVGGLTIPFLSYGLQAVGYFSVQHNEGRAETVDASFVADGQLTLRIDPDAGERPGDFVLMREGFRGGGQGTYSIQWSSTPYSAPGTYLVRIGDTIGASVHVTASLSVAYSFFSTDFPLISGGVDATLSFELFTASQVNPNLKALQFQPNPDLGGVDFRYAILDKALTAPAKGGLYWSPNATFDPTTATPIPATFFDTETGIGTYPSDGLFHIDASTLGTPPQDAKKLLLVLDPPAAAKPQGSILESDETDNVLAIDVSAINPVGQVSTRTTLTSSIPVGPAHFGQSIIYTATVEVVPPGTGLPTGTVTFTYIDPFGQPKSVTRPLQDSVASVTLNDLNVGDIPVVAVYSGDEHFKGSTSDTLIQEVDKGLTFVNGQFPTHSVYGQTLEFDAFVTPLIANPVLFFGELDLYDSNPVPIATFTLSDEIGGPLVVNTLTAGVHHLRIAYSGDDHYEGSELQFDVTVDRAPLTVSAGNIDISTGVVSVGDIDISTGDPLPNLVPIYAGFVLGEGPNVLRGQPKITIQNNANPNNANQAAGRYKIRVERGTLEADNYRFEFIEGTLTVHPKVINVLLKWGGQSLSILNLNRPLPFTNITGIDVEFSDDVAVDILALTLTSDSRPGFRYGFTGFRYDAASHIAHWTLPVALGADRLSLTLDSDDATTDGHNGIRAMTDIYPLNAFGTKLAVLPGDYNGDRVVDSRDLVGIVLQMRGSGDPTLALWADLDGNGVVDIADLNLARKKLRTKLS